MDLCVICVGSMYILHFRQCFVGNLGKGNNVSGGNAKFNNNNSKQAILGLKTEPRRKTTRNYFEPQFKEKFQEAVTLVTSGKASILKAAKLCGIPKSTLYLRLREMGISSSETPYQQNQQQNGNSNSRSPQIHFFTNEKHYHFTFLISYSLLYETGRISCSILYL